jgi:hypothetical protein
MKNIDVVYVLGKGSNWRNNEIRFSLRAIEKNLKGVRKIWIIGEDPGFLKGVNHISHPDEFTNNADGNIIRKVLRACQEEDLTENFLFINDDHLVMKPVRAENIPAFHKGDMTTFDKAFFEVNFWRGRLFRTKNILVQKGYTAYNFDCHVPIIFNKKIFPEVISQFDYEKNIGYTMKSLYGNVVCKDARRLDGEKVVLFRPYTVSDIMAKVAGAGFVSFNDDGLRVQLKEWLYNTFNEVSRFEADGGADPFFRIMAWLLSADKDYDAGCEIYEEYGKAKKAKKYFGKGETKARDMKLEHKIRELLNYY